MSVFTTSSNTVHPQFVLIYFVTVLIGEVECLATYNNVFCRIVFLLREISGISSLFTFCV